MIPREVIWRLKGLGSMEQRLQTALWLEELEEIRRDPYRLIPEVDVADRYVDEPRSLRTLIMRATADRYP
jgi:hypothetical protein